jgi:prophage regulatory protein
MQQITIQRLPTVIQVTGKGRTTIYGDIADGLMTPPVNIGARSVGWPSSEIDAINAARIAGKTDDEIRALVKQLVAKRKQAGEVQ